MNCAGLWLTIENCLMEVPCFLLRMTDIESVHAATPPHHLMLQVLIQGLTFGDKLNTKMHRLYKTWRDCGVIEYIKEAESEAAAEIYHLAHKSAWLLALDFHSLWLVSSASAGNNQGVVPLSHNFICEIIVQFVHVLARQFTYSTSSSLLPHSLKPLLDKVSFVHVAIVRCDRGLHCRILFSCIFETAFLTMWMLTLFATLCQRLFLEYVERLFSRTDSNDEIASTCYG